MAKDTIAASARGNRRSSESEKTMPLAWAIHYANRGWLVFPCYSVVDDGCCSCGNAKCGSSGKHPRTPNGFKDATKDISTIEKWWSKWPSANVGIATGKESGIVVLDVDIDFNKSGLRSIAMLERRFGSLPATPKAITGGGGYHYFFKHPGGIIKNSICALGPGLDIRGDGGYVIAPPSTHVSGEEYEWIAAADLDPAPLPAWLSQLLTQGRRDAGTQRPKQSVSLCQHPVDGDDDGGSNDIPRRYCRSVEEAVQRTLPATVRQRNRKIFDFARALQSIPEFDTSPASRREAIWKWHQAALPAIGTKDFGVTLADFEVAWGNVKTPLGNGAPEACMRAARDADPPEFAARYESDVISLLIRFCRELQDHADEDPFPLSCRVAGALLEVDRNSAANLIKLLVQDDVLELAKPSPHTGVASEYRYRGDAQVKWLERQMIQMARRPGTTVG